MTHETHPSEHATEQLTVERLFRASMDVQCALSMISEERTAALLRQAVDSLDLSIKQIQGRALEQRDRPERVDPPEPGRLAPVVRGRIG